jgi:hypothetical protein
VILTVDSGTRVLAYAGWERNKLIRTGATRSGAKTLAVRACDMVSDMLISVCGDGRTTISDIVVEMPVVYPHSKNKTDPNDLIALAIVAGAALGYIPVMRHRLVTAAEWKGQQPKDVTQRRVVKELSFKEERVLESALSCLPSSLHHNVYDAVGIGLWYLNRTGG